MSKPLHPNQLRAGHDVRGFRVVCRLGVGGYAFVFLVEREGHPYTMKVGARCAAEADEDRVDAWMCREVSSLKSVEHPHLLPVLESGRWPDKEGGYVYIISSPPMSPGAPSTRGAGASVPRCTGPWACCASC